VSRPAVSQHLRALKEAGLVIDRAAGTRRIYQVNPTGVASLRAYLDQVWGDALTAFQREAEAQQREVEAQQKAVADNKERS
jgi:DNA-binding transcriptional ArsR family regulator